MKCLSCLLKDGKEVKGEVENNDWPQQLTRPLILINE